MSGATGAEAPAPPGAPSQARIAARAVARSAAASARSLAAHAATAGRALARFAAPVTGVVSTTGWLVLAAAAVSLVVAWAFGWIEFAFLGFTLLAAVLVSVAFAVSYTHLTLPTKA